MSTRPSLDDLGIGTLHPDNNHETGVSPYEPVPIPHRGRGGAAGGANSKKYLLTGPIRGFCALQGRARLERLPAPSISARSFWSLEVGEPFSYAYTSLTLKVLLPDAGRAQGAIPRSRERARGHRPGSVGRRWLVVAARTVAIMAKTGSGDCCPQEAVAPSHGDVSWK
jgi:hypothetical protein